MPQPRGDTARFLDAWMRLRQIVQARNFNRFHRAGLSATQFMTLNVIPAQGMTLSELARRLNLSAASLNKTVDSLEERGFVRRSRSTVDARKIDISATAEGENIQNAASKEFHRSMAKLFAAMSKTKREGLLAGLEEIVALGEQPQTSDREKTATPRGAGAPRVARRTERARRE